MAQEEKSFQHTFNESRTKVTISANGFTLELSALDLERLAVELGVVRSQMLPCVPINAPTDKALRFTEVKVVKVDGAPPRGLIFLARSELFGWFSATMHMDWRAQLVRYLGDQESEAPTGTTLH